MDRGCRTKTQLLEALPNPGQFGKVSAPSLHPSEGGDSEPLSSRPPSLWAIPEQWSTLIDGHDVDGGGKDSGYGGAFSLSP